MPATLRLDGGEGGGQLLRPALALSLATGRPLEFDQVRGRRGERGLCSPELACLRAAQAISGARVEGAVLGAERVAFEPAPARAGSYLLDLGPQGSIGEALQVVVPALSLGGGASTLKLKGATHPWEGASLHYLNLLWVPALRELGYDLEVELAKAGWGEEGGGEVTVQLRPAGEARRLERRSRGTLREVRVLSVVSNLDFAIAGRLSERAAVRLRERGIYAEAENLPVPAPRSKGALCLILAAFERGRAGFAWPCRGEDPEAAADEAAARFDAFMGVRAAVDEVLAEQLVVPLALAAAGLQPGARPVARFTCPGLSPGLVSAAGLVSKFLDAEAAVLPGAEGNAEVRVAPAEASLAQAMRASRVPPPAE